MALEVFEARELTELDKILTAIAGRVAEARRFTTRANEAANARAAAVRAFRDAPTPQSGATLLEASAADERASILEAAIGDLAEFEASILRSETDDNVDAWRLVLRAAERKQSAIDAVAREARAKLAEIEATMTRDEIPLDPALHPREFTAHLAATTRVQQLRDQAQQLAGAVAQIRQRITWLEGGRGGSNPSGVDTPFAAFLALVRGPIVGDTTSKP